MEFESLYVIEREGSEQVRSWSVPSSLFRYGLAQGLEAQLQIPFIDEKRYVADELISSRRIFEQVQLGFSLDLWKQRGVIPETALMYRALVPVMDFQPNEIGHLFSLNMSNALGERITLNYNLGWMLGQEAQLGYYIANCSYELNALLRCFVEVFGEITLAGIPANCFNTGIGFTFTDSLCLDLSYAMGIDHDMTYFGGNLSYCFNF